MSLARTLGQVSFSLGLGLLGFVGVSVILQSGILGQSRNVVTLNTELDSLQQATSEAQATLTRFLDLAETNPEGWGPISLKVGMRGAEMMEHIWIEDVERAGQGTFRGTLANEPVELTGLELGSRIIFEREQINDWAVIIDDKGYGYFSARATMEYLSEEEAARMTAFLSDNPLPPNF